ncbi:MAG: OmpA family protein [Deltaproteobacteria bacterium]|nr:OmpA family protein [Deltaproteobacteria bacterium]
MANMRALVVMVGVVFGASAVQAAAVDLELVGKVAGKEKPALVLKINKAVASINVTLTRGDGKVVKLGAGALKSGSRQRFELDAPAGVSQFAGELKVTYSDKTTAAMPLSFTVEVVKGFEISTAYDQLDLKRGELTVTLSRPAGRCEHEVVIEDKPEVHGVTKFNGEVAGTPLTIAWKKYADDDLVLKIRLTCYDAGGTFFTDPPKELLPWRLEVPHEEVGFASGKWDIAKEEEPKLDRAYQEIATAVRRYGKLVQVQVYVLGYTDTVADAAYNLTLSLNRARAIAQYFRGRGVQVPIFYTGFGEENLAVTTADNTDEPRNRRARYIVGQEEPETARWNRL